MKYLSIIALFCMALTGCTQKEESAYRAPSMIQWDFSELNTRVSRVEGRLDAVEGMIGARAIPTPEPKESAINLASFETSVPSYSQGELDAAVNESVGEAMAPVLEKLQELEKPALSEEDKQTIAEIVRSAAPQSVVESPTYSNSTIVESPPTYSGPVSYGNARYSGTKTKTVTRKVARTVYEDVEVPVQVPVKKVDVFQTVEEQVPYQTSRTVMETVMVPKQVARQVTETKYRTVSKRVKVGEKEVEDTSYAAPSYSAPAVQYSAPRISYQSVAPVYSAPTYSQVVECAPAPVKQVMQYAAPVAQPIYQAAQPIVQAYSAAPELVSVETVPVSSLNVASNAPCNDPNCPNCNPSYSSTNVMVSQNPKPYSSANRPTFRERRQEVRASRANPVQTAVQGTAKVFQAARPVNRDGSGYICEDCVN